MHDRPGHRHGGWELHLAWGGARHHRPQVRPVARRGPAASEYGVGARWPVRRRWAVERWRGVVVTHRSDDRQPMHLLASSGKCSLIRIPGTLVAIGRNGPRISSGGVGLRVPSVELAGTTPQENQDARPRAAETDRGRRWVSNLSPATGRSCPAPSAPASRRKARRRESRSRRNSRQQGISARNQDRRLAAIPPSFPGLADLANGMFNISQTLVKAKHNAIRDCRPPGELRGVALRKGTLVSGGADSL